MSQNFIPFLPKVKPPAQGVESGGRSPGSSTDKPGFSPVAPAPVPQPSGLDPVENIETIVTVPPSPSAIKNAPSVSVKREGERITQIQVQCSCGQRIELDCSY